MVVGVGEERVGGAGPVAVGVTAGGGAPLCTLGVAEARGPYAAVVHGGTHPGLESGHLAVPLLR